MKKLVQINVTAGRGSTGVIAEEIGRAAIEAGWDSTIFYGQSRAATSASSVERVGSDWDVRLHGVETRLFDNHGLASRMATQQLIKRLSVLNPDVVHLHNIHGYYLNYPILFHWFREWGGPVVWTLHDCWSFTGHCAHFMFDGCEKWMSECHRCSLKHAYPTSLLIDRSRRNFRLKKENFTSLGNNLHIVSCSECVADYARRSFFKDTDVRVIYNGVDLETFHPNNQLKKKQLLGVSNIWQTSKGFNDFFELRKLLPSDYEIVLVGLMPKQISMLPDGIRGIIRTSNREELAQLYGESAVFVNPTYEDNFPTVNIEALACGTPVVTYRTGGSPESVDAKTGIVVERGDVEGLAEAIKRAELLSPADCRARAVESFNAAERYGEYVQLYQKLLGK